jgi:hypothetical protein
MVNLTITGFGLTMVGRLIDLDLLRSGVGGGKRQALGETV